LLGPTAIGERAPRGRPRPRHRRLQRGNPARSQIRLAYNNRGSAYHDKGNTNRAITDYNEAIRLDPKFAFAYSNRAART
jgi:tetratricopeptide (TPR) repeat protein